MDNADQELERGDESVRDHLRREIPDGRAEPKLIYTDCLELPALAVIFDFVNVFHFYPRARPDDEFAQTGVALVTSTTRLKCAVAPAGLYVEQQPAHVRREAALLGQRHRPESVTLVPGVTWSAVQFGLRGK